MNIKVNTNISNEFEEIIINVNAPEISQELQKILNNLLTFSAEKEEIVATKNNEIFLLKAKDVYYFYSDEKNNFAKTKDNIYKVKEKLYELETQLSKSEFIRISNACIINVEKTKSFDASIIGSLVAKMEDGTNQEVSKRRIKDVMKFLNERK